MTRVDWLRLLGGVVLGGGMAVAGVAQGQDYDRGNDRDHKNDLHLRNKDRSRLDTPVQGEINR
jgi:hypothetical protein